MPFASEETDLFFLHCYYRSDVLGQFMPLVGIDWSQTGVAHLFSAIKVCLMSHHLLILVIFKISQLPECNCPSTQYLSLVKKKKGKKKI